MTSVFLLTQNLNILAAFASKEEAEGVLAAARLAGCLDTESRYLTITELSVSNPNLYKLSRDLDIDFDRFIKLLNNNIRS